MGCCPPTQTLPKACFWVSISPEGSAISSTPRSKELAALFPWNTLSKLCATCHTQDTHLLACRWQWGQGQGTVRCPALGILVLPEPSPETPSDTTEVNFGIGRKATVSRQTSPAGQPLATGPLPRFEGLVWTAPVTSGQRSCLESRSHWLFQTSTPQAPTGRGLGSV